MSKVLWVYRLVRCPKVYYSLFRSAVVSYGGESYAKRTLVTMLMMNWTGKAFSADVDLA